MLDQFSRSELLLGSEAMEKLKNSRVCVFGVGGVGGYVVEALARTGVGHLVLVDNDDVAITNINRQIIATMDTLGKSKVIAAKERVLSINPECDVETRECFYLPENANEFDFSKYDYVVDCVDTVTAKISIIIRAKENNVKVISAMGAGNKINPEMLMVSDISKTEVDPLARVMRYELRKRGVNHLKVVYSKEEPIKASASEEESAKRSIPGSLAFVPSVMGLIMASEIIKDLIDYKKGE